MNLSNRDQVSIIVGMRNSATTIVKCLSGLARQEYPIAEIIVIDNVSTDNSAALVEEFAESAHVPVRLIKQSADGGLANSYNTGALLATAPLLILVHSDSELPTPHELTLLTKPVRESKDTVASFPLLLMPRQVWERFPYWQKFLFARALEKEDPSMCGKFDCIRKEAFQAVGGFDTRRFTSTCGYGGEDADFHFRIKRLGKVAASKARVIHLHDLSDGFGLKNLFNTRKMLARTYGKTLKFQRFNLANGNILFFVRPVLAAIPVLPFLFWPGLALQILFSMAHSRKMYLSRSTFFNFRALLLLPVDIALLYFESFWFFEGLLTPAANGKSKQNKRHQHG